jgi:hypothetical protein
VNSEDSILLYELLEDIRRVVERNDPTPYHSADRSSEYNTRCYLTENPGEVWLYANITAIYNALWRVDQRCRSALRYETDQDLGHITLADEIRRIIKDGIDVGGA